MSSKRLGAIVGAGLILASVCTHAAHAVDAFWHGVRSDTWNDGISGGISNWYSKAPPNGNPRDVPTGGATFAKGALVQSLRIAQDAQIGRMHFDNDAPLYVFRLVRDKVFTVNGAGLFNFSNSTPRFTVLSGATMSFQNKAKLVPSGPSPTAQITTVDEGQLEFKDNTKGGDAIVFNTQDGSTAFLDHSSADRMTITNRTGGATFFTDRATGGNAHITNETRSRLSVSNASGPAGDGHVPVGQVMNSGTVTVDMTTLDVAGSFTQTAKGTIRVSFRDRASGGVTAAQNIAIDGQLTIDLFGDSRRGRYTIMHAGGTLTGQFAKVRITGRVDMKARLDYSANEVTVALENN